MQYRLECDSCSFRAGRFPEHKTKPNTDANSQAYTNPNCYANTHSYGYRYNCSKPNAYADPNGDHRSQSNSHPDCYFKSGSRRNGEPSTGIKICFFDRDLPMDRR